MKEQNLIPFDKNQSREEAKKNGRKGGIVSGQRRRERKTMKQAIELVLSLNIKDPATKKKLKSMGIKANDINYNTALIIAQLTKALKGDTRAAEFLRDTSGQRVPTELSTETIDQHNENIAVINAMIQNPPRQRTIEEFEEQDQEDENE